MSAHHLQTALLRPPVLHILRAAGFHSARPSVVDSVADLAARFLTLLADSTAGHYGSHDGLDNGPQLEDVRRAMEDCAVFRPQMHVTEEDWRGEEDLRGLESFIEWVTGDVNREIMRIAGVGTTRAQGVLEAVQVDGSGDGDDFLTALKKKHSKTGNEARYQGTVLGKPANDRPLRIEGGPVDSIHAWDKRVTGRDLAPLLPSGPAKRDGTFIHQRINKRAP